MTQEQDPFHLWNLLLLPILTRHHLLPLERSFRLIYSHITFVRSWEHITVRSYSPETASSNGEVGVKSYKTRACGYASSGTVCGRENEEGVGIDEDVAVDMDDA